MSLIGRYIFREAFSSTLIVLGVLLVIFMSNQFAEILGDAATEELPREAVFAIFGFTFLRYLTFLTPVALLLGVLLALARFNRDSEAAALSACGIGTGALLKPISLLSIVAAAGVAWLSLVESPEANRQIADIRFAARQEMDLALLTPGSFTMTDSGNTVLYVREAQGDQLRGVFIQSDRQDHVVVVIAEEGERVQNAETGEVSLRLRNGRRYEGVPGEANFYVAEFGEHGIPISVDEMEYIESVEAKSTATLMQSFEREDRAEFEWRIAAPLSTLLLVLLAVPLSRSSPREGRYARVGVGLLIYIIYANTLGIARVWIERDSVPSWLGMWWVHAALAVFAVGLLLRESGVLVRTRQYRYIGGQRSEPLT